MTTTLGLATFNVDDVPTITVGPGCHRRDLKPRPGLRAWIVDMEPGSEWPYVDQHDGGGEDVFIVSGELIEGEIRLPAGTYLHFEPHSSHRPRTESGVRLFGINLSADRSA